MYEEIMIILSFTTLPSVFLSNSWYLNWFHMFIQTHVCYKFNALSEVF